MYALINSLIHPLIHLLFVHSVISHVVRGVGGGLTARGRARAPRCQDPESRDTGVHDKYIFCP